MVLEKLILDSFLTYDHLEYDFVKRPLLIQGKNLTDEGQASNGSGKSGIQTGVEFAITASNSRDVVDAELVTYGQPQGRVQLIASCNMRKERIHIDWTIKVKGSNKLVLLKQKFNGEWSEVSFSNVNDGKKWVMAWFAISKEDLFNYYLINKTRFKSFYKSSNREKVELINRISDASIVAGIEEVDTTELQSEYNTLERFIQQLNGKVELTEEKLQTEENRDLQEELDERAEELEDEIEGIESKIESERNFVKGLGPKEVELKQDIEDLKDEKERFNEEEERIQSEISTKKEALELINIDLKSAQQKVDKFIKTDWDREREDFESDLDDDKVNLKESNKEKKEIEGQQSQISIAIRKIDNKLGGAIECPSCAHKFLLDEETSVDSLIERKEQILELSKEVEKNKNTNESVVEEIKESISKLESSISDINKLERAENAEFNELSKVVNAFNSKVSEATRAIDRLGRALNALDRKRLDTDKEIDVILLEISGLSQKKENSISKQDTYDKQIIALNNNIKALKPVDNTGTIDGLKFELSAYKTDIKSKGVTLAEVGDKIYARNKWANNFKLFKMHLANQSLETIEYHNNRYLNDMGSDLRIKLEGSRLLSNGSIKDEITAKIVRNIERSFGSFSGGEKGRLLFASILANRHMINSTHPYGGLDFLSIDEVFEGIDGVGLKSLIKSIRDFNITIMIITHVTDENASSDILTIEKVNSVSKIVE